VSRAKKQLKLRRRRQRGGRGKVATGPSRRGLLDARNLTYSTYSIVDAPLRVEPDPALEGIGDDERDRIRDELEDDPAAAVARIELLLPRYHDSPTLLNWLAAAYNRLGRVDKSEELARLNYERNPKYLFARVNWAEICLRDGDLDAVAAIFENKFDLKLLYPHRDVFHLSEFVGFASVIIPYLAQTGETEAAEKMFDVMKQIAPDHPATQSVKSFFASTILQRAFVRLRRYLGRHGEIRTGRIGC
jgi:hypothetical protein